MNADHERIEELIAARSLGGLDPEDERAFAQERASHGADCAECRRLEDEYAEVAGRLAFSLDPEPVTPDLEDRVVALAVGSAAPIVLMSDRERRRASRDLRRETGPRPLLRSLVAIAAAFVLFVGGWVIGTSTSGDDPAIPPGARVVAFEGPGDAGSLAVAFTPGEPGVYLLGSGLATPPEGSVYEVWMIQDGTPIPGPCVRPEADGSLFAFADAEIGTTETMAVTVESASCPSSPTSDPVFTAALRV